MPGSPQRRGCISGRPEEGKGPFFAGQFLPTGGNRLPGRAPERHAARETTPDGCPGPAEVKMSKALK